MRLSSQVRHVQIDGKNNRASEPTWFEPRSATAHKDMLCHRYAGAASDLVMNIERGWNAWKLTSPKAASIFEISCLHVIKVGGPRPNQLDGGSPRSVRTLDACDESRTM